MRPHYAYEKPDNLVAMWEESAAGHLGNPLFGTKGADGTYSWVTYGAVTRRVDDVRGGLARLGVRADDAVGIIAPNRPEWAIVAFAIYGLKARLVPMYDTDVLNTWTYIARDSGIKVLFVATPAIQAQIERVRDNIPSLRHIVVMEALGDESLAALEERGQATPIPSTRPAPDDVAVLIYTSGTTSEPKGVLLTHGNLTSNAIAAVTLFPTVTERTRAFSVLPWAHIYGQTAELHTVVQSGASVGIAASRETIIDDIVVVQPTVLVAVPRLLNRIYEGVWARVRASSGFRQRLFASALRAARVRRDTGKGRLKHRLLDRLVLAKVRARFGGRLEWILSGSATLAPEVSQFFFDIGVPVYDCYGMTETSPGVTVNSPAAHKLGTVGRPLTSCRVEIDCSRVDDGSDEGEIIVYGPNVMLGYHNKPEATAAALNEDGGLRTGDRGRIDEDGFLHITGRFKNQYKLENGKYVFPEAIEEALELTPYVACAMVAGDGRPYNVGLIVLDLEKLQARARRLGLGISWRAFLTESSSLGREVRAAIGRDLMERLRRKFDPYEIPRRYHFVTEPFTSENGLLTQTMKVKRSAVFSRYGSALEALYREALPIAMPDAM